MRKIRQKRMDILLKMLKLVIKKLIVMIILLYNNPSFLKIPLKLVYARHILKDKMRIKNKTNTQIRIGFKGVFYIFNPYEEKKINGDFNEINFKDESIKINGKATRIEDCFEEVKEKKIKKTKNKLEDKE